MNIMVRACMKNKQEELMGFGEWANVIYSLGSQVTSKQSTSYLLEDHTYLAFIATSGTWDLTSFLPWQLNLSIYG